MCPLGVPLHRGMTGWALTFTAAAEEGTEQERGCIFRTPQSKSGEEQSPHKCRDGGRPAQIGRVPRPARIDEREDQDDQGTDDRLHQTDKRNQRRIGETQPMRSEEIHQQRYARKSRTPQHAVSVADEQQQSRSGNDGNEEQTRTVTSSRQQTAQQPSEQGGAGISGEGDGNRPPSDLDQRMRDAALIGIQVNVQDAAGKKQCRHGVRHLMHQRIDVAEKFGVRNETCQRCGDRDEQRHLHPGLHARPPFLDGDLSHHTGR